MIDPFTAEQRVSGIRVKRAAHTAGMPARLRHTMVDAHDLPGLARFWTQAPGWKVLSERENEIVIGRPERARRPALHAGHRPQDGQEPRAS